MLPLLRIWCSKKFYFLPHLHQYKVLLYSSLACQPFWSHRIIVKNILEIQLPWLLTVDFISFLLHLSELECRVMVYLRWYAKRSRKWRTCGAPLRAGMRWGTREVRVSAALLPPSPCTWRWSWAETSDPVPSRTPRLRWRWRRRSARLYSSSETWRSCAASGLWGGGGGKKQKTWTFVYVVRELSSERNNEKLSSKIKLFNRIVITSLIHKFGE